MNFINNYFFLSFSVFFSCTNPPQQTQPFFTSQKYTIAYPSGDMANQITTILKSVKKLSTNSIYTAYHFNFNQNINKESVSQLNFESEANSKSYFNESSSGTATILNYDSNRILVLTCAHIGDFPDTIITTFQDDENRISSVAVRGQTDFFIQGIPGGDELDELVRDREKDLAFYGRQYSSPREFQLPQLSIPLGEIRNLRWGSFVYMVGFPMGVKMVTRGVVSLFENSQKDMYLIDANFNMGFSGGLVLAYKQGTNQMEWVGLVKSVSANSYFRLKPSESKTKYTDENRPYKDELYLERTVDINYGVTYAISPDVIQSFLKENKYKLEQAGFNISRWLE